MGEACSKHARTKKYNFLIGNHEEYSPLGRRRHMLEYNIKMNLK
jgi:hypothetical protein